jgi:hypothetical protein
MHVSHRRRCYSGVVHESVLVGCDALSPVHCEPTFYPDPTPLKDKGITFLLNASEHGDTTSHPTGYESIILHINYVVSGRN